MYQLGMWDILLWWEFLKDWQVRIATSSSLSDYKSILREIQQESDQGSEFSFKDTAGKDF